MAAYEKIFEKDELSKRERIELALNHEGTDRVPLHEQLSYSPGVVSMYTGKKINGFDYTVKDVGLTVSKTLDCCFPVFPHHGTGEYIDDDGFMYRRDNWTVWHVSRPFTDEYGARDWLHKKIKREKQFLSDFNVKEFKSSYRDYMLKQQKLVGETVVFDFSINTGFCDIFDKMGLEIYTFFGPEFPDVLTGFITWSQIAQWT